MRTFKRVDRSKALLWLNWLLAISALLLAGAVYRVAASRLKLVADTPVLLPVPLSAFPKEIHDWTGKDVPLPVNVQRVARADDFLSRLYINRTNNRWANVYIPYTAHPRTMLGHRPQVCYPAGGWVHDSTEPSEVISSSGREIPCLIHRFHMPAPGYEERIVLNFYILNGQLTADESGFSGVGWRTPNIDGDPARYVAQVQISSVLENSVLTAAEDMADLIVEFFPDENGKVGATEYTSTTSDVLK